MDSNTLTLCTSVLTLATLLVHSWLQSRNRRWDIEDRERRAAETAKHREEVIAEIRTNTDLTQVAAQEATDANQKLQQIGAKTENGS